MVRDYAIDDAARSLDQEQTLKWIRGWQVVDPEGGSNLVTAGTGDFEYDAAAGDINAGGSIVTCSQESVDFQSDIDTDDDKIAVIYRDASGTLQKSVGAAGTRDPAGDDVQSTFEPPPPTLSNTDAVILAEVLLPAGASSIGSAELHDRRDPAAFFVDSLDIESTLTFGDEAADPSSNGEVQRNSGDVKVFSGGAVRNLSDVGALTQAATGTVTLSGGSTPAVDTLLTDVLSTQTETIVFALYVDADPAFNADYAFNHDYTHAWDDSDSAIDIDLTVNWDTDPGGGNDVTARWEVFA